MQERIKKVMSAVFGVAASEINEETSTDTLEKWDSLKHMALVISLEEEFGVRFSDEEIVRITDFPAIRDLVRDKSGNG